MNEMDFNWEHDGIVQYEEVVEEQKEVELDVPKILEKICPYGQSKHKGILNATGYPYGELENVFTYVCSNRDRLVEYVNICDTVYIAFPDHNVRDIHLEIMRYILNRDYQMGCLEKYKIFKNFYNDKIKKHVKALNWDIAKDVNDSVISNYNRFIRRVKEQRAFDLKVHVEDLEW